MSHAILGPSGAERWMTCTASPDLIQQHFPDGAPSSSYAQEGTWAHELIPLLYHQQPTDQWRTDVPEIYHEEMWEHAENFIEHLKELGADQVMLEQRVHTPSEQVWGTADVIARVGTRLVVLDFKYGRGVSVKPNSNPQLKLYAIGALDLVRDLFGDIDQVDMGIYQPRTAAGDQIKWADPLAPQDLMNWWEQEVVPAIEADPKQFNPSPAACRFCPVAGVCEARMMQQVQRDFKPVGSMTPEQIGQALEQIADLEVWIKQVQEAAMGLAYEKGQTIPGWKVVRGTGRRTITDQEEAIRALMKKGYRRRDVARSSTVTLTQLDKIVGGKDRLGEILGDLLRYSPGKPTLATEQDPREAIASAETEFTAVDTE